MSENLVTLSDGYVLDLNKCLICKVCNYYYDKDDKVNLCGICENKLPTDHYEKCSIEPVVEDDMGCFHSCDICHKYFCKNHIKNGEYTIFTCCQGKYHSSICQDCVFNNNVEGYEYLYISDVLNYIDKLKTENSRLQAMLDYQPGGSGFVEAKEHFEELSGNLKEFEK